MRGTVLYGPRDIRFEDREDPTLVEPTDAVIRMAATCVCGSDLWPYRGLQPINGPTPMGHEYCGFVEEVGREVKNIKPGQFVVGSFATCAWRIDRLSRDRRFDSRQFAMHRIKSHPGYNVTGVVTLLVVSQPGAPPIRCCLSFSGRKFTPCTTFGYLDHTDLTQYER